MSLYYFNFVFKHNNIIHYMIYDNLYQEGALSRLFIHIRPLKLNILNLQESIAINNVVQFYTISFLL